MLSDTDLTLTRVIYSNINFSFKNLNVCELQSQIDFLQKNKHYRETLGFLVLWCFPCSILVFSVLLFYQSLTQYKCVVFFVVSWFEALQYPPRHRELPNMFIFIVNVLWNKSAWIYYLLQSITVLFSSWFRNIIGQVL